MKKVERNYRHRYPCTVGTWSVSYTAMVLTFW